MGTPVSGKLGKVSADAATLENLLRWSMTYEIDQHASPDSDSDGWDMNVGGIKRWSGSLTVKADEGQLIAALDTAMTDDVAVAFIGTAYTGKTYSGNIKLSNIADIGADVQAGTVEEITYNFVGHGALTRAAA